MSNPENLYLKLLYNSLSVSERENGSFPIQIIALHLRNFIASHPSNKPPTLEESLQELERLASMAEEIKPKIVSWKALEEEYDAERLKQPEINTVLGTVERLKFIHGDKFRIESAMNTLQDIANEARHIVNDVRSKTSPQQ